jgi:hypothetical protein
MAGTGAGSRAALELFINGQFGYLFQGKNSGLQRQWNVVDTVSLALGRHQFKFGADYRRLTPVITPPLSIANFLYLGEAEVLANSTLSTQYELDTKVYPLYKNFSAFAEDEWKASQRLNISMGLRWEVNPAPGVTQGLMPYAIQGSNPNNWVAAPQGTPLWRTTWYNFAPRLGAAYIIRDQPGWETVIRGGGGIFFDTAQQLGSGGFGTQAPGFFASTASSTSFPNLPSPGPVIQNPPDPNACSNNGCISLYGFAQHLQLPYTTQWNFSLEQAMGKPRSLTASPRLSLRFLPRLVTCGSYPAPLPCNTKECTNLYARLRAS